MSDTTPSAAVLEHRISQLQGKLWQSIAICDLIAAVCDPQDNIKLDDLTIQNAAVASREALKCVAGELGDLLAPEEA